MSRSVPCAFPWALFFLSGCFVLFSRICVRYPSIFYFIIVPEMLVCLLRRDRKGVDSDGSGGGDLGEADREETTIRIYYILKNIFSIKKNPMSKLTFRLHVY